MKLGAWATKQRQRKNRLTKAQIHRLDRIKFSWDPLAEKWDESFDALTKFREIQGNCRVPQTMEIDGIKLGIWVTHQRSQKDELTEKQVRRLESLGFEWRPRSEHWEKAFNALKKFNRREEHCNVAPKFIENNLKLGAWVSNIRNRKE